ncbi:unnamed protein product, partial [Rotaria socialis]
MMSLQCSIETCKRTSDAFSNLFNRLAEETKIVSNRYLAIDRNKLVNDSRQKLDKWRENSLKTINRTYEEKCKELDQIWTEK